MDTLATPPCASFPPAPAMDYVPFSGHYQQAGLESYVPPKRHKHHGDQSNGQGGTSTPTTGAT
jgi:hypothetical protein